MQLTPKLDPYHPLRISSQLSDVLCCAYANCVAEHDTPNRKKMSARWRGFSMSPHQINCHSIYQLALAETYHLFGELFGFFFHFLHTVCDGKPCQYQFTTYSIKNSIIICILHTVHIAIECISPSLRGFAWAEHSEQNKHAAERNKRQSAWENKNCIFLSFTRMSYWDCRVELIRNRVAFASKNWTFCCVWQSCCCFKSIFGTHFVVFG